MNTLETRIDLIKILEKNLIICEIGVFKGDFSDQLLNIMNPKELHLIDIFEGKMCSGDKDGNNIIWTNLNEEYIRVKNKFKDNDNVFIHKGFSSTILNNFKNDYFDMIYIDGDHSYSGVKNDLNLSFLKTKKNGYICGHDYSTGKFPEVVKAVNEFCKEKNVNIEYITNDGCPSFCIIKQ